ncbi:MAG: histidine--tRNA ligase [Candidatus Magasanikbacteria bacterium]
MPKKIAKKNSVRPVKSAMKREHTKKKDHEQSPKADKQKKEEHVHKGERGYAPLRGMKDILPKDGNDWLDICHVSEKVASAYGFSYMETPIVEQASLFIRSIGKGTDVVDKEMYIFDDKDGGKICLRPEMTASIVRAYINHGMQTFPQPVKVWYMGPMFRHDRPQAGRYREFHQFGCETIGEHSPVVDAELISVAYNTLRDLGLETSVHINSIGTLEDRSRYIVELVGYLRTKRSYLSEDSKYRLTKNPLRILDSKDEHDRAVLEEAPQIIDWLSDDSKKFFTSVLEYLDEAEIPYVLTPTLVRGLDYYTDTVFEFYTEGTEDGSQSALGGGGRYNGLSELLGGQATPGSGFSLGMERIAHAVRAMRNGNNTIPDGEAPIEQKKKSGIFFAHLGEQARKRTLYLIEELRRNNLTVHHNLAKTSLKTQLELANKFGVEHTLILGQKEVQDGTVLMRNMDSGIQEIIDQKKIAQHVRKMLGL